MPVLNKLRAACRSVRLPFAILLGLILLYTGVLMPLNQYIISDIVLWYDTVWGDVVDVLAQLTETLIIACIFGFIIYALWKKERKMLIPTCVISALLLIFKYVFGVFTVGWAGGIFYFPDDLWTLLLSFGIELIMIVFTFVAARLLINRVTRRNEIIEKASQTLGKEPKPVGEFYPFRRVLLLRNPLQVSALLGMIAVLLLRTLSYVMQEIAYTMEGAVFTDADLPVVIFYWFLTILIPCCIGYFAVIGCILLMERLRVRKEMPPKSEAPDVKEEI